MEKIADNFTLTAVFGGMLFLVWVLPALICRRSKFPEDRAQPRKA